MVHHGLGDDISLILQVGFLLFVFATLRIAWRGLPQNQRP
jgi:hypothetical protein